MRRHLVIPDTQVRPWVPLDHLDWIGRYAVEMLPDVIVHLGDHADMHSLSVYDRGTIRGEGARYQDDIDSANHGWHLLNRPIEEEIQRRNRVKTKVWRPERYITLGNHEQRIERETAASPNLERKLSYDDLDYARSGWKVHDFLSVLEIDGVWYSHYFVNPGNGRPYSGMVETRLKNVGHSFIMGHQQEKRTGERYLADGRRQRALIHGACYLHDEGYRGPQANNEWRGIFVLNEVRDGDYDLMEVSLDFLCRKYERMTLPEFLARGKHRSWPGPLGG